MAGSQRAFHVTPIRVLIAERSEVLRAALREYVVRHGHDIAVVGTAGDSDDAIRQAMSTRPDVIVTDLSMQQDADVQFAKRIHEAVPHARMVFVSGPGSSIPKQLREYGVCLVMRREELAGQLLEVIRSCGHGAVSDCRQVAQ